jgi:AAA+ ATPase superfamily predicted ATPase
MMRLRSRDGGIAWLEGHNHLDGLKPQLLIVYGRRRVGKTELLVQFMRRNPDVSSIYFLAGRKRWAENLRELRNKMAEVIGDDLFARVEFSDYIELFSEFSKRYNEQIIITIDEFPYLHDPKHDIESMFQKIYDEILSKTKIYLILCGSSIAMMESMLGYASPLYGRRTGQIPSSFSRNTISKVE